MSLKEVSQQGGVDSLLIMGSNHNVRLETGQDGIWQEDAINAVIVPALPAHFLWKLHD